MRISDWSSDVCSSDLRHDLEPRFERIVRIDQFEMRVPAIEQGREQPLEMDVHRLERGEQPLAALAIEVADRSAQPVDRQPQFLALGGETGRAPGRERACLYE